MNYVDTTDELIETEQLLAIGNTLVEHATNTLDHLNSISDPNGGITLHKMPPIILNDDRISAIIDICIHSGVNNDTKVSHLFRGNRTLCGIECDIRTTNSESSADIRCPTCLTKQANIDKHS